MRLVEVAQLNQSPKFPTVCPKPDCTGSRFISHEDGWQCLNCMKIIYRDLPLPHIANNHPERVGCCSSKGALKLKNDASEDEHLFPAKVDQNDASERWVAECVTIVDSYSADWFLDCYETAVLTLRYAGRLNRFQA